MLLSFFRRRLVWVTPYTFLNAALAEILPAEAGSDRAKRGTVNVLSKVRANSPFASVVQTKDDADLSALRLCYRVG